MKAIVIAAVLGAAVLHAGWNAMLKSGSDRFFWMAALCVVQGLISVLALFVLGLPAPASWPYVAASAAIHVVYQLLLVRMYAVGDFGQTYPVARGSSPLFVTFAAFLLVQETLSLHKAAGVLLVCGGIMALAFEGRRFHLDRTPMALATGLSIGAYTVVDGIGARLSGNAVAFVAAFSALWMIAIVGVFIAVRGFAWPRVSRRDAATGIAGGIVAMAGYATVVWAMTVAPMGLVSALRETSVVFAAVIAHVFLNERLTLGRLCACAVIAGGGALLAG